MLNSSPAVAGGAVYVGGHYRKVYALNAGREQLGTRMPVLRSGTWLLCSRASN
jgi:outer membrane protein assembly factor BamB